MHCNTELPSQKRFCHRQAYDLHSLLMASVNAISYRLHQKPSTLPTRRLRPSYFGSGCTAGLLGTCGRFKSKASDAIVKQAAAPPSVNVERVYQLESKLKKAGFTEQQARSLLVTTARLRRLREQINMEDLEKLFRTAWQIEDDMIEAGFNRVRARQLGAMFIALAGTKQTTNKYGRSCEEYWVFWEVSDASRVDDCLEQAGGQ